MKIECIHCGAGGQIDETKIPPGVTSLNCPRCKKSFPIPTTGGFDSQSPREPAPDVAQDFSPPLQPPPLSPAADPFPTTSPLPSVPASTPPQAATVVKANCSVCSGEFPRDEMVRFGETWVCAKCKPLYVQGLACGKPVGQGAHGSDKLLEVPRICSVGDSLDWISKGFGTFRQFAISWIVMTILLVLLILSVSMITIVFQLFPIIGWFIGIVFTTAFTALFVGGMFLGCRTVDRGERLTIGHLFSSFDNDGKFQLVYASVINRAITMLMWVCMIIVIVVAVGGNFLTANVRELSNIPQIFSQPGVLIPLIVTVFVGIFLQIMISLLFMYVPLLTLCHKKTFGQAISLSCKGVITNIIPIIIFSIIICFLYLLGVIPILLGCLVVYPVMLAAIYHSYKQIFLA